MKRIAMAGAGSWASGMHVPVCVRLRERGRAEYCGVCDLDLARAERAAGLLGARP